MKKVLTGMALAVLCTGSMFAQTATETPTATTDNGDKHCLAQADQQTWSTLGLNDDQILKVKEIQLRYKMDKNMDRGTENTMRGTTEDAATPTTGSIGTTGTTGTSAEERNNTDIDKATGTTTTTDVDRADGTNDAKVVTPGKTGTDTHGTTTSTGRTSDQLGYDDTHKESMERELKTVLTTAQFESYQAWCQDQDNNRGDRNMDMDR